MNLGYAYMNEGCRNDNSTSEMFRNKESKLWYPHPLCACGSDW
jgi:hypothetical protein